MKKFFNTTLIGGLVALLPLGLLIVIFRWLINIIEKYLGPLVRLINTNSKIQVIGIYILAIIAIILFFFVIGLVLRTQIGLFFRKELEQKYLSKIPGYKLIKETVEQFFGNNRSFFSEVVLVDLFDTGTLMTGFITDNTQDDYVTVFVPTGPNPTSGNIYHVPKNKVTISSAQVDVGMKSIVSCGAGSSEIFEKVSDSKKEESQNNEQGS